MNHKKHIKLNILPKVQKFSFVFYKYFIVRLIYLFEGQLLIY